MGHAGAWAAPGEPDAHTKYQALERAGAVMVNHPEKFGEGMSPGHLLWGRQYTSDRQFEGTQSPLYPAGYTD
jgi:hypothetical protein